MSYFATVAPMGWSLIFPALATVIALGGLTFGLRRVEAEALLLRQSLRRTTATAVAVDELGRALRHKRARADELDLDAAQRIHRVWRSRRPRRSHGAR